MLVEIVNDAGQRRALELVRFDGDERPVAVLRWELAGAYDLDLRENVLRHSRARTLLTNWRAANVEDLRQRHAAWRDARRSSAKPAILKGR